MGEDGWLLTLTRRLRTIRSCGHYSAQKNSPRKFFGSARQHIFCRKSWALLGINFFDTRNILKQRKMPLRNDSVLWDKIIWRKIVILAPSLILNIFRYQKFCEIQKGSPTKFSGTVSQHNFCRKLWALLGISFSDTLNFLKRKDSSTKRFRTVTQNKLDRKSWYSPPFLSLTFIDIRDSLKHRRVPL